MGYLFTTVIKHLFSLSCIVVTIAMITFWVAEFIKDKDLCLVDYIDYSQDTKDSAYPTVSLCFLEPISTELLKVHNATFDDKLYAKFLLSIPARQLRTELSASIRTCRSAPPPAPSTCPGPPPPWTPATVPSATIRRTS